MSVIDRLNEAAALIAADGGADLLTKAVGEWLRAEAVTQQAMPVLVKTWNMAIKTAGGPEAYLVMGVDEQGEPAMHSDTNQHALTVASEVLARYGR
jgi:hypothetical protein